MMSRTSTALVSTPQKAVSEFIANRTDPATPPRETFPPSPGTFRHPRLTEIITRQSASTFTNNDLRNLLINSGALLLTFVVSGPVDTIITTLLTSTSFPPTILAANTLITIFRIILVANIILSLQSTLPYLSKKDEIADIPLTPSQRALLGLNPSTAPTSTTTTPGQNGNYITPPRYRHTSGTSTPTTTNQFTPTTDRRSTSANYSPSSSSTLTPSRTNQFSPSPQSHRRSSGSPLTGKSITQYNNHTHNFETSLNRSTSSLARSQSLRERDRRGSAPFESVGPGTPSPSSRRAAAGINYKWLYDKGSRLPKSESMGF